MLVAQVCKLTLLGSTLTGGYRSQLYMVFLTTTDTLILKGYLHTHKSNKLPNGLVMWVASLQRGAACLPLSL